MIFAIIILLFAATVFLPVEIRAVKKAYRKVVLVWAQEVQKAWTE